MRESPVTFSPITLVAACRAVFPASRPQRFRVANGGGSFAAIPFTLAFSCG